jgi:hypothetical protein
MLPLNLDATSSVDVAGFARSVEAATLWSMDSVRFGRALGVGARAAAKTLVTAVDAATAPNPSADGGRKRATGVDSGASAAGSSAGTSAGVSSGVRVDEREIRTVAQVQNTSQGLKEGSKRFGSAVGKPLVRLSGVLWLELTGVFFGLFAVTAAGAAWRLRDALRETAGNHEEHVRFLVAVAVAVVFGYFCLSSFVKANRRSRQG